MDIMWENLNTKQPSLEHAKWHSQTVHSTVIGLKEQPFSLQYTLRLSSEFYLQEANISLNSKQIKLLRSEKGLWTLNGLVDTRFQDCDYIDIQATPLTNTLPIRHLQLAIGQSSDIKVVWVGIPSLEIKRVQQRYTRLKEQLYRYENLTEGYSFDLNVDGNGFVIDYPTRFIRRF